MLLWCLRFWTHLQMYRFICLLNWAVLALGAIDPALFLLGIGRVPVAREVADHVNTAESSK